MITAAFVLLGIAVVGFSFRLVRGPSLADRIIAIDGLLLVVISILAVETARTGDTVFVDAIVSGFTEVMPDRSRPIGIGAAR